ncbi:MAG: hypothetical protein WCI57_03570 [Candidatus Berkelbacteria bacterium]
MVIRNGLKVLNLREVNAFLKYFEIYYNALDEKEAFIQALKENSPLYKSDARVRWELAADHREWPEEAVKVIMDAAKALRMLEPQTWIVGNFDAAITIGGANQAPLARAEFVMDAISRGHRISQLVLTGSSKRELKASEIENVKNYARNATTEFGLARAVFDLLAPKSGTMTINLYRVELNNAHNYNVLDNVIVDYLTERLPDDPRICAVTTQIYQQALELDLLRVARKHGIPPENILAAGTPSTEAVIKARTPLTYLAEINRTIWAAVEEATA